MSTPFTIGFARKKDLSDFSGVVVNYDGYANSVIPTFMWISRFGYFSDLVKQIKGINTGCRGMRTIDEIMNGEDIFEVYPDGGRAEGRDDFFYTGKSYLINSRGSITYYMGSDGGGKTFKLSDADWKTIDKRVFEKIFNLEKYEMRKILYMALYRIEPFKNIE